MNQFAGQRRSEGASWDDVLTAPRVAGATPMQCVQVLRKEGAMSLSAAKDRLNQSGAWADQRERFEAIQEELGSAFDDVVE